MNYFQLAPDGGGTRLTFVHAGFGRTTDISDYGVGWLWFLLQLTDVVRTLAT